MLGRVTPGNVSPYTGAIVPVIAELVEVERSMGWLLGESWLRRWVQRDGADGRLLPLLLCGGLVLGAGTELVLATHMVSSSVWAAERVRVGQQFGLVYAPLSIARELKTFEKHGLQIEWRQVGSGGAINEALISGQIDIGFMGIPPFLVGWDKGVPWKVAVGFNEVPVVLVTYRADLRTLSDIGPNDRIAVPSPGSVQHILLSMAAKQQLGNAHALDDQVVAMSHPDGAAALLSRRGIAAHFTTPPYAFDELSQPGFHTLLTDHQAFGGRFSFNIGAVTRQFYEGRPKAYQAFIDALAEAMQWLESNKRAAAKILAPEFNLSEEKTYEYLTWEGVRFTPEVCGLMKYARFMYEQGYIRHMPSRLSDIAWPNVVSLLTPEEKALW